MNASEENDIPITANDIRQFNFEEVLYQLETSDLDELMKQTCVAYERFFADEAKKADVNEDIKRQTICELFGVICSFHLQLDEAEKYAPKMRLGNSRTLIPSDLSLAYRQLLLAIVFELQDSELQARVADILWVLKDGKYPVAILAVDAYLKSATRLVDPEHWTYSADRIERALQIAALLGKNGQKYREVIDYIQNLLAKLNGEDPSWFSHKLMTFLLEHEKGEASTYIMLAQKVAEKAESVHDWHRARDYWEIQAKWYTRQQDETEIYNAYLKAAETYIYEANNHLNQNPPAYRYASHKLGFAVEALRRIRAPQDYIQSIHKKLLDCQEKDDDFQNVSLSFDNRDFIEHARKSVKGKSLHDAILVLSYMTNSPSVDELKEFVLEQKSQFPMAFLFSHHYLNSEGRVTAKHQGMSFNNEDGDEEALRAKMYEQAGLRQDVIAQSYILPAIYQINLEHHIRYDDLMEFVTNNPFVPPYHESFFLRGFYYGLLGDFMLATHLLVPQIENSIRYLLKQRGVVTSKLDSQGIQDDFDLGKLLFEVKETEEIFGKNLLFDLQGLLVNRFGSNMRNSLAHGLLSAGGATSSRAVYLWGLVLKICCYPILLKEQSLEKQPENNIDE